MKILKGEIIRKDEPVFSFEEEYHDKKDFFLALVGICDKLNVDVPIWTSKEDRIVEQNKAVRFMISYDTYLQFSKYEI
ncbi:hypothetical protein [Clostridiisalibacter paucivorans]|uniref:hypothetical protein n=1 Tax=Clostridiisalibacter paucivorans TaxID=408753 RepID=UPI00047E3B17|nr:hypothetical protein [Clostridiisalibacter paucivorans]